MHRNTLTYSTLAAVLSAAAISGACNRDEEKMATSAEVQTQTSQPANMPVTVSGCVKAGEAADTYVLTVERAAGAEGEAGTYQLTGDQTAVLRDHVGRRAEVSGTVVAEQEIASRSTATPAGQDQPAGTSGTPTVQTRTEIDVKRLAVTQVKPLGDKCD
jgi:hypothetical protein